MKRRCLLGDTAQPKKRLRHLLGTSYHLPIRVPEPSFMFRLVLVLGPLVTWLTLQVLRSGRRTLAHHLAIFDDGQKMARAPEQHDHRILRSISRENRRIIVTRDMLSTFVALHHDTPRRQGDVMNNLLI